MIKKEKQSLCVNSRLCVQSCCAHKFLCVKAFLIKASRCKKCLCEKTVVQSCRKTFVHKGFCAEKNMCVKAALGKVSARKSLSVQKLLCVVCVCKFLWVETFRCKSFWGKSCSVQKLLCLKGSVFKRVCAPLCLQKHLYAKHPCGKKSV